MSRDPYKRRERQKASDNPIREPKREYYPDVKPRNDHTGERHGKLVIIQPYCKIERPRDSGAIWEWVGICDCGNTKIFRNLGRVSSCGCLKGEKRREWVAKHMTAKAAKEKAAPKPPKPARANKGDDWADHCHHSPHNCIHYADCLGERVFQKAIYPSRHQPDGGCYTPGREEIRYLGEVAP